MLSAGACTLLQTAPDAHFKFHAMRALLGCLERIKEALAAAVGAAGSSGGDASGGAGEGTAAGEAQVLGEQHAALESSSWSGAQLPIVTAAQRNQLKAILWAAWEVS